MLIGRDDTSNDVITLGVWFHLFFNRDFKIQRRGRQRERKKKNKRFNKQNNNFARAARFLVDNFLFLHDFDIKRANFAF